MEGHRPHAPVSRFPSLVEAQPHPALTRFPSLVE